MKSLVVFVILIFVLSPAFAQKSEVYKTDNAAINGYDPVAYFKSSAPVKGTKEFSYTWNDAVWYFSNDANLQAFKASPEKFAPQYGGYCAYGTSEGHKAPTKPEAWTVVNNKLYLNYNKDVQVMWSKDKDALIRKADKNWVVVKSQE